MGLKGNARTDSLIDLHSHQQYGGRLFTQAGPFYNELAAYVKMMMPEAIISRDDIYSAAEDHALMCTLGRYGVLVGFI
ncbi:hypothetical protein [Alishewanella longhuensis]